MHTQQQLLPRPRRLLAVRTLQLEMLYVYRALEDEALDIAAEDVRARGEHSTPL